MTTVVEIQRAIEELTESDYAELREWLLERDWDEWDREIEADSKAGRLNFLDDRLAEAKRQGTLKDL